MENKNIFLGKLNKDKCYMNDGKYGWFLTCNKKNYKIPEWFEPELMTLSMAEKYITYKEKMSKLYSEKETKNEKGTKNEKSELSVEEESD